MVYHRGTEATEGHGATPDHPPKHSHEGTKATKDTKKNNQEKMLWTPLSRDASVSSVPSVALW
jgi:hypothetical protein